MPGPGRIDGAQLEPTNSKINERALYVMYAETTKVEGPTHFRTIYQVVSRPGFLAAMPNKVTYQLVDELRDGGRQCHGQKQVNWHSTQNMAHKS